MIMLDILQKSVALIPNIKIYMIGNFLVFFTVSKFSNLLGILILVAVF